jgi:murein L,D-transpeptidase YcbB/YkuD
MPWERRARLAVPLLLFIALAGAGKPAPKPAKPARKPVAKVASPADTALSKAVAGELRTQAHGPIGAFYAKRGYWPLWVHEGGVGAEAKAFLHDLDTASLDGLRPGRYDADGLRSIVSGAGSDPAKLATAELALSRALVDYVADVRRAPDAGITWLDPDLKPGKLKPQQVLRAAEVAPSFPAYVTGMGWMSPLYADLRAAIDKTGTDGLDDGQKRSLRLTMDRLRILPGPDTRSIVVDAASARLYYYDAGKQQGTMRVVVGAKESQTPMLAGRVRYAILNPYWNVPVDLVQKKIAPRVLAGASLKAMHYEALADWSPGAAVVDPSSIDWNAVAAGSQEARVRQLPGGPNFMGKVKFMFPNNYGIYLHDTPERALLSKPDRHLSNGCVRLEDAPAIGRFLIGKSFTTTSKQPEQDVPLGQPVPVYLTYLTAVPTAKGVGFVPDVYGRDGGG